MIYSCIYFIVAFFPFQSLESRVFVSLLTHLFSPKGCIISDKSQCNKIKLLTFHFVLNKQLYKTCNLMHESLDPWCLVWILFRFFFLTLVLVFCVHGLGVKKIFILYDNLLFTMHNIKTVFEPVSVCGFKHLTLCRVCSIFELKRDRSHIFSGGQ